MSDEDLGQKNETIRMIEGQTQKLIERDKDRETLPHFWNKFQLFDLNLLK